MSASTLPPLKLSPGESLHRTASGWEVRGPQGTQAVERRAGRWTIRKVGSSSSSPSARKPRKASTRRKAATSAAPSTSPAPPAKASTKTAKVKKTTKTPQRAAAKRPRRKTKARRR
jgi:hypothetical protein